ncbi:MAG: PriCT-2 domain-containing protein, partial [Burkholderiales bacterium]
MNPETVRAALAFIPPTDRDLWLRVGMAIKSGLGDAGFDVWDEWSRQDESYSECDARAVWRSIKANGKVTPGTLFHEAQRRGFKLNGAAKPEPPTIEELAEREQQRQQAEAEEATRRADAKERAAAIWNVGTPASDNHPYLKRKGVQAHGLRLHKGCLVVPLRDVNGDMHSLQFIPPDSEKTYLRDGSKTACYFAIGGKPNGSLCIAEGFATAASIFEATGIASAAAMDAGNLKAVALALRSKLTDVKLILCADDDYKTPGNPGLSKAREAALAVDGLLAVPDFGSDRPEGAKDFNDLRIHRPEGVEHTIANAVSPDISVPRDGGKNATASDVEAHWPEPTPIEAPLLPVEAFNADVLLPDALRAWIMDEADRMPCAPDFIAAGAIVALGALIGARCAIKPKSNDDWLVVPNLWGSIVANPSAKKTPSISAALKPLDKLIAEA